MIGWPTGVVHPIPIGHPVILEPLPCGRISGGKILIWIALAEVGEEEHKDRFLISKVRCRSVQFRHNQ